MKKKRRPLVFKVLAGSYKVGKFLAVGGYNLVKKTSNKIKENRKESLRPKIDQNYDKFNIILDIKGSFDEFENKILKSDSTIGLILGARGSGKSAIGIKLLENFKAKTNKNVYAVGFKKDSLPRWVNVIDNIEEIKNDSFVLVDEGGIEFSSRESMSDANKLLSKLLFIARHKNLHIAFISQNSSNIEINTIRQSDYLMLKPSSLLQKDFERKKIKEIYNEVEELFNKHKDVEGLTYIYSNEYRGFVSNPLPSFWSSRVSKGYSDFKKD